MVKETLFATFNKRVVQAVGLHTAGLFASLYYMHSGNTTVTSQLHFSVNSCLLVWLAVCLSVWLYLRIVLYVYVRIYRTLIFGTLFCFYLFVLLFRLVHSSMPAFSHEEKLDIILIYGECHRNATTAVTLYVERYPDRRCPSSRTIAGMCRSLSETGSWAPENVNVQTEQLTTVTKSLLWLLYLTISQSARECTTKCTWVWHKPL